MQTVHFKKCHWMCCTSLWRSMFSCSSTNPDARGLFREFNTSSSNDPCSSGTTSHPVSNRKSSACSSSLTGVSQEDSGTSDFDTWPSPGTCSSPSETSPAEMEDVGEVSWHWPESLTSSSSCSEANDSQSESFTCSPGKSRPNLTKEKLLLNCIC